MTALGELVNAGQNFLGPRVFPNDVGGNLNLYSQWKEKRGMIKHWGVLIATFQRAYN